MEYLKRVILLGLPAMAFAVYATAQQKELTPTWVPGVRVLLNGNKILCLMTLSVASDFM